MVNMKKYFEKIYLLMVILFVSSCSKDAENQMGIANINFEVIISDFENNSSSLLKTNNNNVATVSQEIVLPFEEDKIISLLVRPAETSTIANRNIAKLSSTTESNNVLYRLLVFDSKNKLISDQEYNTSNQTIQLDGLNSIETYSFILYTLVTDKLPALNINIGDSWDKVTLNLSNSTDLMISTLNNIKLTKGTNTLKTEFKHIFTKVKVTLNSTDVGKIANVGAISMNNIYNNASVNLFNQKEYPKNISFSNPSTKYQLNELEQQGDDKSIYSNEAQIIFVDGVNEQTLLFDRINLTGGAPKNNISVTGFKLIPGKSYEIIINIKKIEENSIQIGDLSWSLGNLIATNNVFSFENSQAESGNFFYRDASGNFYNIPAKINDSSTRTGERTIDLCKNVGEQWRTPTQSDITKLEQFASWYSNTNKFVGTYKNDTNIQIKGVYFGTTIQPSEANKNKYLFLPFTGAYNSGKLYDNGQVGFYWFKGQNIGASFQFAPGYMSISGNGGEDRLRANSIRCVKNAS